MSLVRFSNQLPSVFNNFFDGGLTGWSDNFKTNLPSVNIKENKNGYELELAVPGFEKEDFNIELNQDVLTVSLEKNQKMN